jgi:hypothetical protein
MTDDAEHRAAQVRRRRLLRQRLNTGVSYRSMSKAELIAEIERLQDELAFLKEPGTRTPR